MLYPVNLKISHRLCIIVGGGQVALRKARGLIGAGATVRVISPELANGFSELVSSGQIEWLERGFVQGDLLGAFLVFAATDNREIQKSIEQEAEKYSVLLNSADDPVVSNFHVPAHFRRGKMLMTVSTGGGSPALARIIREQLEENFVPEYEAVVALLGTIREKVLANDSDFKHHKVIFHSLLAKGFVDLVLEKNWFDLQLLLISELPEGIDSTALLKQFLEKYDQTGY